MQNVAGDEQPQISAATPVISDSQAVSSSTVAVDNIMNETTALNMSACLPPADTAEPEPGVPVDTDHAHNCCNGGTFMNSWLFLYKFLVELCLAIIYSQLLHLELCTVFRETVKLGAPLRCELCLKMNCDAYQCLQLIALSSLVSNL